MHNIELMEKLTNEKNFLKERVETKNKIKKNDIFEFLSIVF